MYCGCWESCTRKNNSCSRRRKKIYSRYCNFKKKIFKYKKFETIAEALLFVPRDTAFIIGSPPEFHFAQAKQILQIGRDIIIEKPIFISNKEVETISKLANFNKNIILEGFMYRYTKMYDDFFEFWKSNKGIIKSLKSCFHIPDIPVGTYRDDDRITSSCLYDMGCYGLSVVNDLGLNLDHIHINSFVREKSKLLKLSLKGMVDNISIEINFGKSKCYENYVQIVSTNNKKITYYPFFYGRGGEKTIVEENENKEIHNFIDDNGFQKMFNLKLQDLHLTQKQRFKGISFVTKKLENLAYEYEIKK